MADGDMKNANAALARLQSLDGRLMELDRLIGGIPGRRAAVEARLGEARGVVEAAKGGAETDAATRRKLEREIEQIESAGLKYVGKDETGERCEIMELGGHPYFVGTQYHPEFKSRPGKPSPPYLGLLKASVGMEV